MDGQAAGLWGRTAGPWRSHHGARPRPRAPLVDGRIKRKLSSYNVERGERLAQRGDRPPPRCCQQPGPPGIQRDTAVPPHT
ncbi:unnamed protein product [Arctogadus glacialis]